MILLAGMYVWSRDLYALNNQRAVLSIISQVSNELEIYINIRRRSVTIREIHKASSLNFTYLGKNQENMED